MSINEQKDQVYFFCARNLDFHVQGVGKKKS